MKQKRPIKLKTLQDLKFEKQRLRYDLDLNEKMMLASLRYARETFRDSLRNTFEETTRRLLYLAIFRLIRKTIR